MSIFIHKVESPSTMSIMLLFGHLLIGGMSPWISEYTGIAVRSWDFQWMEIVLIPGLILMASIVGFLPAAVAYKQDVATSLAP